VRRGNVLRAFAVASVLSIAAAWIPGSASAAPQQPDARCIREGLAPIPVTVRASVERREGTGAPVFEVRWSGKPLAAGCRARRTVAVEWTLWFPHLRFAFTEGFLSPWLEFWSGRKPVRGERERYVSNASYRGLGCIRRARARLRYEVVAPGGAVVGRRVVQVPVRLPACSE
jgi:hypothetical protein